MAVTVPAPETRSVRRFPGFDLLLDQAAPGPGVLHRPVFDHHDPLLPDAYVMTRFPSRPTVYALTMTLATSDGLTSTVLQQQQTELVVGPVGPGRPANPDPRRAFATAGVRHRNGLPRPNFQRPAGTFEHETGW
jgi:hypothetical protein